MYCLYILKYFLSYAFCYSVHLFVHSFNHSMITTGQFCLAHAYILLLETSCPCSYTPFLSSQSGVYFLSPWILLACDLAQPIECDTCWSQGWAFRNLMTSVSSLRAPRHYVKKSPASLFLPVGERGNWGTGDMQVSQASWAPGPQLSISANTRSRHQ